MFSAYKKYFLKQKMMRSVMLALLPIIIFSVYNFGWKALALLVFNIFVALIVEFICEKNLYKKNKISEAAIITASLYTMTLPVSIPFWMSGLGIAFGLFFGKEVFGGFGKNVFNPALVGRVFIYVNFPVPLTIHWNEAAKGLSSFTRWVNPAIDAVSTATPMLAFKNAGETGNLFNLFLGNIPGAIGETSKLLIILAAIYLIWKKVASKEIILSTVIGFLVTSLFFNLIGAKSVPNPLFGLMTGGFLFGAVFMATDPISAPKTNEAKIFYGLIIGMVAVIIRGFALFSEGMMFAVLIGNIFAPIMDYVVRSRKKSKKLKKQEEAAK
ncbi:RnfABCDGE type electron transport complex subunit D [Peptoniphilus catoniae]|uniref:RnfABCDGE type electron transport complex subunit D n=1 Tax=Peptoniphilus catoniae TaxID=1660341 RepID=UPI0010FD247B|nr:RnfABCDGE type electron transport complex subunit D [Peptoniphilus catoniae]